MSALIEALREEHRDMARLLAALAHQITVFAEGRAPDYDVILGVSDYFLDFPTPVITRRRTRWPPC